MKNSLAPMTLRNRRRAGGGRWMYGSWPWLWEGLWFNRDPKEPQHESPVHPQKVFRQLTAFGGWCMHWPASYEKSRDAVSQVHWFLWIQASVYDHTGALGHIATTRWSYGKLLYVIWGLCSLWFYSKNCTFFPPLYCGGWWWWYLDDSHGQLLDS